MKRSLLYIIVGLMLVSLISISCEPGPNKIHVATDATHPPFSYTDEQTKEIVGFDIDLIKAIANKEALDIEIINADFQSVLDGTGVGKYDAAIGAISITEKRKQGLLFSAPYFVAGHVVTTQKDNTSITGKDSLPGKTVGVQAGTTSAIDTSAIKGVTVKSYADYNLVFQALMDGVVDAVISDNTIAADFVSKNPDKLKITGAPFSQENYGIAVSKYKSELLTKINTGLQSLKSEGFIDELSEKWLPASGLQDTVITLQRTACFGRCPIYKLTAYGNGTVIFEGVDYVKIIGKAEGTISQDQVEQLISEFDKVDYFSLNNDYKTVTITDHATAITSITIDGKTKTIEHYLGDLSAPKSLTELEDKIDEIVNSNQWIK